MPSLRMYPQNWVTYFSPPTSPHEEEEKKIKFSTQRCQLISFPKKKNSSVRENLLLCVLNCLGRERREKEERGGSLQRVQKKERENKSTCETWWWRNCQFINLLLFFLLLLLPSSPVPSAFAACHTIMSLRRYRVSRRNCPHYSLFLYIHFNAAHYSFPPSHITGYAVDLYLFFVHHLALFSVGLNLKHKSWLIFALPPRSRAEFRADHLKKVASALGTLPPSPPQLEASLYNYGETWI